MKNGTIEAFQRLATEKRTLLEARCQAGVSIQDMFAQDVEFTFEYNNVTSFNNLWKLRCSRFCNPSLIRRSIRMRRTKTGLSH